MISFAPTFRGSIPLCAEATVPWCTRLVSRNRKLEICRNQMSGYTFKWNRLIRTKDHYSSIRLNCSPITMLEALHRLFATDSGVTIISHDFENQLTHMERFDTVTSSFAIHHVSHKRKRALYQEIFELLAPNGVFCNLEHVADCAQRVIFQITRKVLHKGFAKTHGNEFISKYKSVPISKLPGSATKTRNYFRVAR